MPRANFEPVGVLYRTKPGVMVLAISRRTPWPRPARSRARPTPLDSVILNDDVCVFSGPQSPFMVMTVAPRRTTVPLGVFPRKIPGFTANSSTVGFSWFLELLGLLFPPARPSWFRPSFAIYLKRPSFFVPLFSSPPPFSSPSFFSSFGGSKEMAESGWRKKLAPTAQVNGLAVVSPHAKIIGANISLVFLRGDGCRGDHDGRPAFAADNRHGP